jgi:rod shape-determining protein MreC
MGNSWNWKQTFAFFLLFVPALIFYALQKSAGDVAVGTVFQKPAHIIQQNYDRFTNIIQETLNTYFYLVNINTENKSLKTENAQLASQIQLLEEYRSENIRLRKFFKFQQEFSRKTISARVISKDILIDQPSFTIDKGSEDGIERLQGVISAKGVVGYILEVEKNSSRVLLISNHNASIDSLVQKTRARGIVSGISNNLFKMNYLMRKEDAQVGDLVVTSGRQGFFPQGFNVGTVKKISSSPTGVSFQAIITPAVKLDRLENVLVIVEKKIDKDLEAK